MKVGNSTHMYRHTYIKANKKIAAYLDLRLIHSSPLILFHYIMYIIMHRGQSNLFIRHHSSLFIALYTLSCIEHKVMPISSVKMNGKSRLNYCNQRELPKYCQSKALIHFQILQCHVIRQPPIKTM